MSLDMPGSRPENVRQSNKVVPSPGEDVLTDQTAPSAPLLEVKGLRKTYSTGGLFSAGRKVVAAEDVGFRIHRGEAVALVGESGSGKSTIARLLMRLERADAGEALLDGVDVFRREPRRASRGYRRRVQMVFQDPFGSLNPAHDIEHHLLRPLLRLNSLNPAHDVAHHLHRPAVRLGGAVLATGSARLRAIELLRTVGLEPAEEFIHRHPYELSGGQRQRVAIARSLAADPDLLVADEPTSMLDVSIRMGILNLLAQLKRERGLAILLITHDLASARFLAERIVVLYRGRVVEDGPNEAVVESPAHPYTRALLASIAEFESGPAGPASRAGGTSTAASGRGCPFADRCPEVHDLCRREEPAPREHDRRRVRCHLYPAPPAGGR
jgi:peptide/nickel transport system ATP-binding protein